MRFSPSAKEQLMLDELSLEERFQFAVTRMCECEEVWSLGDDNGWLIREVGNQSVISIWPYRQMALDCQSDETSDGTPISVSLEHFLYTLLKQCESEGIMLEVIPSQEAGGMKLGAAQLYEVLDSMVETGSYFIEG